MNCAADTTETIIGKSEAFQGGDALNWCKKCKGSGRKGDRGKLLLQLWTWTSRTSLKCNYCQRTP